MEKILSLLNSVKKGVDFEHEEELVDKGLINSIDVIAIIAEIENQYGVVIPSDEILPENFNSAAALKELIDDLM